MGTDGEDGLVAEFLVESREHLDTFEQDVVALGHDAASAGRSASAFRALHTLKGTSTFFGFTRLESLAHLGESVLACVRDDRTGCVPSTATSLMRLSDLLRAMLAGIEEHGREPDLDTAAVEAGLWRCLVPHPVGPASRPPVGGMRVASGPVTPVRAQGAGLQTREEPVEQAWSALPRLVRDLAEASGKQVRLVTARHDTPVDRTLLAAVKHPLTHLVRNAVDHGVESARERGAAGKPAEATLTVRASATQDETVVEVSDDGRGVDLDRVRRIAVARDVVRADLLAAMSEDEVVSLVLRPGFSTASAVTHVSGRGVGLDVVRHDVERVGGRVEILSRPGLGCTVRLRLPHAEGTGR